MDFDMDNFYKEKDEIFRNYSKDFREAFEDEYNIADHELDGVVTKMEEYYGELLEKLYKKYDLDYSGSTFREKYENEIEKYRWH